MSNDDKLLQFKGITGVDEERSKFYLESSNWQVDLALAAFYENDGQSLHDDFSEEHSVEMTSQNKSSVKKPIKSSNIHDLTSFQDSSDSSDSEKGQAFYAGGSERSGLQILGPPKKKGADFVTEMFKRAKEQGAEVSSNSTAASSSSTSVFEGLGFTLGSSDIESQAISSRKTHAAQKEYTLKLWSNGFSLDDGPLRSYEDSKNREFLSFIAKGKIPFELLKESRGCEVHINMEDHKSENYTPPKVSVKPFGGSGHVLGSIVPHLQNSSSIESLSTFQNSNSSTVEPLPLRDLEPVTNIQIRLPTGGSPLLITLNHSHTIRDVRNYIENSLPDYSNKSFSLFTNFPKKELTDETMTVKDADILGASLFLRLK